LVTSLSRSRGQAVSVLTGTITAVGANTDLLPVGGGWTVAINQELARRRRERKRREELEEAARQIEEETTREIALLLREQEAKDARRSELARLSDLVAAFSSRADESALRVQKAIKVAATKQTTWALFQLEREIARAQEEEDFILIALRTALDHD
jgi:hypothetical protein